ncbi:protein vreteno [Zeugodacus cucurbitae]|uniref:Tudor domain-containing protein 1 n=1 Tax=Zeugodacus cucurbitae TaxID=28588 RepID=A0A0A1WPZ7_ZEUCU|nr:protein vreteno [Zeugodacus cucurbitae]
MQNDYSVEELQKELDAWNPMRDDYTNSTFNKYSSGPGAYLDAALQPAQQAEAGRKQLSLHSTKMNESSTTKFIPYLVLKNLPPGTTKKAIYNICKRHGRVSEIRDSKKNDYFFIDFPTVAEMESVYRGLVENQYGFSVLVGKQKHKQQTEPIYSDVEETLPPIEMDKNIIDFDNRNYRSSEKNLPRPHFEHTPIINQKAYEIKDSLLQRNDPHRHFLITDDAHQLERAGLKDYNELNNLETSKYKYRTGRAYIEMSEKSKTYIEEKSSKSLGGYDSSRQIYENNHNDRRIGRPINIGHCANCNQSCDIVCARCQTYFCGLECQRKAWPNHRQICGKENFKGLNESTEYKSLKETQVNDEPVNPKSDPNMSSSSGQVLLTNDVEKATTEKVQSKRIPRSGNLVALTAISKTNIVFIRSKADKDDLNFFKLVNDVQNAAKHLKKLSKTPICGQIVITDFEGQYNRAMILNSDNERHIKLVYVDYGNLDARKLEDLYEAPEQLINIQRFVEPVILKDVPDMYMTEEIRKFMYSYLDGIDLVLKYDENSDLLSDQGVYQVELIDEVTNQNFNKMIAKLCKPKEPTNPDEAYFMNYLHQKKLPEGNNIELVVMDNSLLCTGCISCSTRDWAIEIEKFQSDLQLYGESLKQQCYTPRIGELCIAKYKVDSKWYRGRCLEIVGDGFPSIMFFDYGNIGMVNVKDIRRYPAEFTFPIYTCDCEIKGLPEQCDTELVQKLEEFIPNGSTIHCESVTIYKDENFHALTLPKLIQNLKAEGLLKNEV